jgi:hypothetical protein
MDGYEVLLPASLLIYVKIATTMPFPERIEAP